MAALLAGLSLAVFVTLGAFRQSFARAAGDEGTYLAMAASAALDGDLAFDERDLKRIEGAADLGRQAVILQRGGGRVTYSKPALHALLAAPFYRLLGEPGVAVFNALALAGGLLLAAAALGRRAPSGQAALAVVTFAGASVLPAYVAWDMSDALQAALALAGLALALARPREGDAEEPPRHRCSGSSPAAALGGAALGLLAFTRYPNALVGLTAVGALLAGGRPRRAAGVALAAAIGFGAASAGNFAATGVANPYKAERASFHRGTGYPAGEGGQEALAQFAAGRATHSLAVAPALEPAASAYGALYFFAGRHTGLLLYFPAALPLAVAALGRRRRRGAVAADREVAARREGRVLALGAVAAAAFYLVWMPDNYFGGEGFVGNRYFLAAYPLLLFAAPPPRGAGRLALTWGWAALAGGSALWSVLAVGARDHSSQNHARRGLFRLAPYESTAPALDGRTDRYWSDEFVRFVDPFARVGEWSFVLAAGDPAAEVLAVNDRPHGLMRFVVHAEAPAVEVIYRDWRGEQVFPLSSREGGVNGQFAVLPAAAWRRHPFWWDPATPRTARLFRLAARTPDGRPAQVGLRYLGAYAVPERIFEREVLAVEIPARAVAGTVTPLAVRVRNTSRRYWSSQQVLPVYVTYRLHPVAGASIEGRRAELPERVRPGQLLDLRLPVVWPREPGRYRLVVDLVLEGVAWFAEKVGGPLAAGEVEVELAAPSKPGAPGESGSAAGG